MSQLDKLPVEVIQQLLSYMGDATTLCRLASTCSTCIINNSEAVWEYLFQKRWTKANSPYRFSCSVSTLAYDGSTSFGDAANTIWMGDAATTIVVDSFCTKPLQK